MKLGKKTHYAVVSLIYLAHDNKKNDPVSLSTISASQDLSLMYLEKLFVNLRNAGIVQSVRGPGGGYKLEKKPIDVSVWDIGLAVGEVFSASQCDKCAGDNCSSNGNNKSECNNTNDKHNHTHNHTHNYNHETHDHKSHDHKSHNHKSHNHDHETHDHKDNSTLAMCKTYALWDGLENTMQTYLESISLDSLLDSSKCDWG